MNKTKQNQTVVVSVRMSPEMKELWEEYAETQYLKLSVFIKHEINKIINSSTNT